MVDQTYGSDRFESARQNITEYVDVRTIKDIPERNTANLSSSVGLNGDADTKFTTATPHGLNDGDFTTILEVTGVSAAYNGFHLIKKDSDTEFTVVGLAFVGVLSDGKSERSLANNTRYLLRNTITTALGFRIGAGSKTEIFSDTFTPDSGIVFSAVSATLFEATDFRNLTLTNLRIVTDAIPPAIKNTVFSVIGNVQPFINPAITLDKCLFTGWNSMGTEVDLIHREISCIYLAYGAGYTQTRVLTNATDYAWEGLVPAPLVLYTKLGQSLFQGANAFKGGIVNVGAGQSVFDISADIGIEDVVPPAAPDPMIIANTNKRGAGNYFKLGTNELITSFADASEDGPINAVSDVGGLAEFTTSASNGMKIGTKVVHTGFASAGYNGKFEITLTPTTSTYQVKSVLGAQVPLAFIAADTSGAFDADVVVCSTNDTTGLDETPLGNGTPIVILATINYSDFGKGFKIFDLLMNTSFRINAPFVAETTLGSDWKSGSINEIDERVMAVANIAAKPSKTIGGYFVDDNLTATTIAVANTFQDVAYDPNLSAEVSTTERTRVLNFVNGEVENRAVTPFNGTVTISFSAFKSGSERVYKFSIVKNGNPLPDLVESIISIKTAETTAFISVPVRLVQNDKIKLQVKSAAGETDSITISHVNSFLMMEG